MLKNHLKQLKLRLSNRLAQLVPEFNRKDVSGALNRDVSTRGRFCSNPFEQLDVYENGNVYACCSAWLPVPLGNIRSRSVDEVWNSKTAQKIRASIHDGSFRYCDHRVCPRIQNASLPTVEEVRKDRKYRTLIEQERTLVDEPPSFINLCNDASCNLFCPSCRTERINHTHGAELASRQHLQDQVVQALFAEPTDRHFRVSVTGSGDPFASRIFREFLYNLDGNDFPNLKINLQTNGVLLTPRTWKRLQNIHDNIEAVIVSFDAATEDTYARTRRGGHWPTLLENTRALGEFRARGDLKYLRLDFVVQQANFREMPDFVRLAQEFGADSVGFSMLLNWGTWPQAEFENQCVWKTDHPEFDDFMDILRDPILAEPMVDLGNLSEYRRAARSRKVEQTPA